MPPSPAATRDVDGLVAVRVAGAYDRGPHAHQRHRGPRRGRRGGAPRGRAAGAVAGHRHLLPPPSATIVLDAPRRGAAGRSRAGRLHRRARGRREPLRQEPGGTSRATSATRSSSASATARARRGSRLDADELRPGLLGGRRAAAQRAVHGPRPLPLRGVSLLRPLGDRPEARSRPRGAGVQALPRLCRERRARGAAPRPTGRDFESGFEEDVAPRRRRAGAGKPIRRSARRAFRIDISASATAVAGALPCLRGGECGRPPTYHGRRLGARGATACARRSWEGMGWRFHRIWSTDWYYRRDAEIAPPLRRALEEARAGPRAAAPARPRRLRPPFPEPPRPVRGSRCCARGRSLPASPRVLAPRGAEPPRPSLGQAGADGWSRSSRREGPESTATRSRAATPGLRR